MAAPGIRLELVKAFAFIWLIRIARKRYKHLPKSALLKRKKLAYFLFWNTVFRNCIKGGQSGGNLVFAKSAFDCKRAIAAGNQVFAFAPKSDQIQIRALNVGLQLAVNPLQRRSFALPVIIYSALINDSSRPDAKRLKRKVLQPPACGFGLFHQTMITAGFSVRRLGVVISVR